MKKIYTLLSIMLTSSVMFAQVDILNDEAPGTTVNGTTINVDGYEPLTTAHLKVVNKSGASIDYRWRRTIINSTFTSMSDQLCDDVGCYVGAGITWTSLATLTRAHLDTTVFLPKINTYNGGSALIRYYILDSGNGDAIIDSVDIQFNSFVGIETNEKVDFSVYPNPANNVLNIQISDYNTSITIFDIVGKNVATMKLENGKNILNIESLNSGVYFYSIKKNGQLIETKKLIVK